MIFFVRVVVRVCRLGVGGGYVGNSFVTLEIIATYGLKVG